MMLSVGQLLKKARQKKGKTIFQIHKETKISPKIIEALENDDYQALPPPPFTKGFIRLYAQAVGLSPVKLIAIYRRVQEDNKIVLFPKTIKSSLTNPSFFWSPKIGIFFFSFFLLFLFAFYFLWQIKKIFSPPYLVVNKPQDGEIVYSKTILVQGKTDADASLYINDLLINTDEKGNFKYELNLFSGENTIEVKAVDRRKRQNLLVRKIIAVDKKE